MVTKLIDKISELIRIKLEQFKLEAQGQIASAVARIIVFLGFLVLVSFAFLFFGLTLAFLLNEWTNSSYLGFLIVAGLLVLAIIILGAINKTQSMAKAIEKAIIDRNEDEEDHEAL